MVNKEQLEEIERLSHDEELFELEELITAGKDSRIPITFTYPNTDKKVKAMIRPLTSNEWNQCSMKVLKFKTSFQLEVVSIGLLNSNGKKIPSDLIELMPQGAISEIYDEIARISGVSKNNDEELELATKMMGF